MASGVRSGRHWSAPAYRAATTCLMLLVAANARASTHEEVNALQDDYRTTVISDHLVVNVDASLRQWSASALQARRPPGDTVNAIKEIGRASWRERVWKYV